MEKPEYKVILIPSSDDEDEYNDNLTFKQAEKKSIKREDSGKVFSFATEAERNAFVKGVEAMEGWNGEGKMFFS